MNTTVSAKPSQMVDSSAILLGLFPDISVKELHIFTPPSSDHQNKDDRFVGKQIDQCFLKFLKFDVVVRRKDYSENVDDPSDISRSDSVSVFLGNSSIFTLASIHVDTSKYKIKYWTD